VIYLVQHGEKEQVPGDPGLTALGRVQAAVTARWFRRAGLLDHGIAACAITTLEDLNVIAIASTCHLRRSIS